MSKYETDQAAGTIWGSLRSMIPSGSRREAAKVIIAELPVGDWNNVPYDLGTRLLLADAGELDDAPQRDECDLCSEQAVWKGIDNEYDGNPRVVCNSCVGHIEDPVVIE